MLPVSFLKTWVEVFSTTIFPKIMRSKRKIKNLQYSSYKQQKTFVIEYALSLTTKRKKKPTSQPIKQAKFDQ